jgi:4-hydroxy-4-methyl-2-oxoglutarate aldolase
VSERYEELARLGSATVYEAGGRRGYVDADLVQVVPGSRVAGPARTVRCGQDDNLMVHAVIGEVQPGEVIVLSMPEPRPVALVGELLATQAKAHGAAAMLIDASVRDLDELAELGLPIWARWVRVRGADKDVAGTIGEPVTVGGATIRQGDVVVLDGDGAAVLERERVDEVLERERVDEVLEASRVRAERERVKRTMLEAGSLSLDLDRLRERLEAAREAGGHASPGTEHE